MKTAQKLNQVLKSKITKILNSDENSNRRFLIKWQNQQLKQIKRIDNNFHIPGMVHASYHDRNVGLNLN